uniref:Uncharacterized protein LOC111128295 n=1 Tax=Crassostrea virginica TaxID=6565 RepID=A0A8B8DPR5_CRAVI|nr:uncharacterized protein LOC111128295 [Crassostrea virginica]
MKMIHSVSTFFMLSVIFRCSGIAFSNSEANVTRGQVSCNVHFSQWLSRRAIRSLERGHVAGVKVVLRRGQLNNSTTEWILLQEGDTRTAFFSVYPVMSMAQWALSWSFQTNVVSFSDTPSKCLGDVRENSFRAKVRQLVIEHVHNYVSSPVYLCSEEFENATDSVNPIPIMLCCKKNGHGEVQCEEIQTEGLATFFFVCLFVMKLIVVIFIIRVIPKALYRKRHCYKEFIFSLKAPLEMEITKRFSPPPSISKLRTVELGAKYSSCGYQYQLKFGENLDRLSDVLETMDMSKTENYKLRAVWFKVDPERLVKRDKAPVGFLNFLYRRLFQCKCYVHGRKQKVLENLEAFKDRDFVSLHDCCKRKISKNITWETLLRNMVQVFTALFILWVPIIVITITWNFEERFIREKVEAAKFHNVETTLPFYSMRLATISFMYGFYSVYQACFVVWFLPLVMLIVMKTMTDDTLWKRTVWVFLRSLVYVKHFSTLGTSWAASFLLRSFTSKTLTDVNAVNVFLWIIVKLASLVVVIFFLLFCKLSLINMLVQLLWRFSREIVRCLRKANEEDQRSDLEDLVQDKSNNDCENSLKGLLNLPPTNEIDEDNADEPSFPRSLCSRFIWCFFCFGWLAFIVCGIPIFFDFFFILIDIFIFIIIGLIINIRDLAQYFLIVFFICVYAGMYVKRVEKLFQQFNNEIQNFLLERHTRSILNRNLMDDTTPAANRCYQVIPGRGCGRCAACHVFTTKNGIPKWKARHLVQFIDDKGEPCIPKNFFFQACYINHHACPGSLSNHYYQAVVKSLFWTLYFLAVVFLVKITHPALPWWGPLLIYTLLGLLPVILTTGHISGKPLKNLDTKDDIFKQKLEHIIREYKQEWPVIDLEVSRRTKSDDSIPSLLEGNDDVNNDAKCWFQTPNKTCVCLNIPNQKPTNVDDTIQTESAPPTPVKRTNSKNGFHGSRTLRGQWSTFDSGFSRQSSKSLQTTPPLSPSRRQTKTKLKSSGSIGGDIQESLDSINCRPSTRSSSGKQKSYRGTSDEMKPEGSSSEGIHFLPKTYPGSCCVSTKDDTISIASTLSNHSHDQHHQEAITDILKNMKSLNHDGTATQTLVADV